MPLHPKSPSSLASFKSRLVLRFWYRLTQVVVEKRSLNGCSGSSSSVCVSKFVGEFFGSFYTVIVDVLCGATSSGVKVACYCQAKDKKDEKQNKPILHEQRIIWPGFETQKPKGIKISTHLQVSVLPLLAAKWMDTYWCHDIG